MPIKLDASEFLALRSSKIPIIDVRSPGEFDLAHIPEARNVPLFDDEERSVIGTLYKQVSKDAAMEKGLEIVGPKMAGFLKASLLLSRDKHIAVYCARGGKRSESMAWLLENAGFKVYLLQGGYKFVRRFYMHQLSEKQWKLIILGGKTGSKKTEILTYLEGLGAQVVDLEKLANHKGSAFGSNPDQKQPSLSDFENNLADTLLTMDSSRPIWVENESRFIGRLQVPSGIWNQMRQAPVVHLQIPTETRLEWVFAAYASLPVHDLESAFQKIRKRMGPQHADAAISLLKEGKNLRGAARIALDYYDKLYQHLQESRNQNRVLEIPWDGEGIDAFSEHLFSLEEFIEKKWISID